MLISSSIQGIHMDTDIVKLSGKRKLSSSGALHSKKSLCSILRVNVAEKDTNE